MNALQYILVNLMNLKFLSRYTGQILMNLMDGQGRLQFIFPLTLLEFRLFACYNRFLLCSVILLVSRFEWPNGDKYTGQYINGKRNGLGDMQVGDIGDILGTVQDIKDIFSMVMAISTREPGEMVSTTGR